MALIQIKDFIKELEKYPQDRYIEICIHEHDFGHEESCAIAFVEHPPDIVMRGLQQTEEGDKDIIRIDLSGDIIDS